MYSVITFLLDGRWHSDIVREDGVILYTSEACETSEDAERMARDYLMENFTA